MIESLMELIKALIWPSVILFIFISLKTPILLLLEQLPNMAAKASKISFSGVSLEIDHKLSREDNSPELREAMKGLTTPALKEILETGDKPFNYLRHDWERTDSSAAVLCELQTKGLIDIYEGQRDPNYPFEYKSTDLGKCAYDLLLRSVIDIFMATELNEKN